MNPSHDELAAAGNVDGDVPKLPEWVSYPSVVKRVPSLPFPRHPGVKERATPPPGTSNPPLAFPLISPPTARSAPVHGEGHSSLRALCQAHWVPLWWAFSLSSSGQSTSSPFSFSSCRPSLLRLKVKSDQQTLLSPKESRRSSARPVLVQFLLWPLLPSQTA